MGNRKTDQLLVERVQQGDRAAYDVLVRKYQHKIVKLISRYVRDHADALDVAQEAFIKAYRALPNFRGDSAFYTWLYRIAINTAKNHLVAERRRPVGQDVDLQDPGTIRYSFASKAFGYPGRYGADGRDQEYGGRCHRRSAGRSQDSDRSARIGRDDL